MELVKGTLDMLILRALLVGPNHGYGVARWLHRTTRGALDVEEGSLYPALHRLARKGFTTAEWGVSDQGQRAKFYTLTPAGRARLDEATQGWERFVSTVALVLDAPQGESH